MMSSVEPILTAALARASATLERSAPGCTDMRISPTWARGSGFRVQGQEVVSRLQICLALLAGFVLAFF